MLIAAVLASALLHAAWNALLRSHPDKRAGAVAVIAIAAASAAVVAAVAAAVTGRASFPGGAGLAASLAAGVLEGAYFACLSRALTLGALGPVYTISRGGSLLAVWPLSVALYGEAAAPVALAGTAVLLAGLAVAGLERAVPRAVVGWAVAIAACIAGYHLVYKQALAAGAAPAAVYAVAIGLATPVQAVAQRVSVRAAIGGVRAAPAITIAAGLLCTASFVVFLFALARAGAGAVLTLRNTSVVFALGLGALVGDRPSRRQIVGAALVAAGAILVGLA